ncbi:nicotinate-nucleotide--dimethylbenzimidazole phosphoribosyltransferase [Acetobacteraceae bacterium KSS8]|uniref:Nicotinate-nucleotide--dimethylbenzimidazole phosphoribosyltransferase n=1 Tax=Endosaccharibacter trunci TaxID=2812733 RepID=A0ABT1W4M2_9PROT|nr:nicotinate-nucleotide--dimethylbenzimidazole phosphoribosyltransferase [Acetobacteraceae bacterium KSS8]
MTRFSDLDALRAACGTLPAGSAAAEAAVQARQAVLTKPPGSLGQLELLAAWLARWQDRPVPRLDRVSVLVFAGNHGVAAQNVSPYPPAVTAQMVANFAVGGAAISQLARVAGAELRVVEMNGLEPTRDLSREPAMDADGFLRAVETGAGSVAPDTDLLCLGEMGIGNTTVASALCAGLFGGPGAAWAGRGTGLDDEGVARKAAVIDRALRLHETARGDPLEIARRLGGLELAAILGATLEARRLGVPVLLDGFVCTAAAAPLFALDPAALDHARIAHRSAEAGHRALAERLGQEPILDLGLRLGEGSGAALAVPILRASCACHAGMASFAEAGVSDRA